MAIENQLERIATCLEALCEKLTHIGQAAVPLVSTEDGPTNAEIKEPLHKTETPEPKSDQSTIELDSEGLPWDARIHSGAKVKKADGTWKPLRGVDKDLVESIKAELGLSVAAKPPEIPTAPATPAPPAPPAATQAGAGEAIDLKLLQLEVGKIAQQLGPRAVELQKILSDQFGVAVISALEEGQRKAYLDEATALLEG